MTKTQKHHVGVLVEKNAFVDSGEGVVTFPNGLTITDDSEQRNGTKYDIKSMDISEYEGQVTANHVDTLENIIAKVDGVQKKGNKVIVNSITYAIKQNPLAQLAYNLLVGGYSKNFSIETIGPWPDEETRTYQNAKLIGLSQVVVGNNKSATINGFAEVVKNSLEQSKENGLDVTEVENLLEEKEIELEVESTHTTEAPADTKTVEEVEAEKQAEQEAKDKEESDAKAEEEARVKAEQEAQEEADRLKTIEEEEKQNNKTKEQTNMTFVTIKNSRDFAVVVKYKNAAGEEVETTLEPGKTVDVSEDQKEVVETQVTGAAAPKVEEEEVDNAAVIAEAVKNAISPFQDELSKLKEAFSKNAEEPKFVPAGTQKTENKYSDLSYKEVHAKQINAAWDYLKLGNITAANELQELNQVNLDALKEAGKVENSLSIADFGNFVISPELLTEIQGFRSDYTAIIAATDWRETLSLQFAWLKRSGDINMQAVGLEDANNANLKPISEYTATPTVSNLEELAAVTPVCNAATRFLAADLLGDVARGYRNDYDRKRAQLVIARLQQAVNANATHSINYSVQPTPAGITSWVQLWAKVSETALNGVFVFNYNTYAQVQKAALDAGSNGPLSSIFTTGDVPRIFGNSYIIVPNDLMPSLNTGETRSFVVDGAAVTINHAVFYFDLNNFTGRTSGGLQYDLSTEASYEVGGVVKSAYQRNELVLRGSFFRGGAILDDTRVAGMKANVAPIIS